MCVSCLVTEVTTGTKNCAFFFRCLFGSGLCCGTLVYTFALVGFFLQVYASCEDCFFEWIKCKKKNEQNENKRALAEHPGVPCVFTLSVGPITCVCAGIVLRSTHSCMHRQKACLKKFLLFTEYEGFTSLTWKHKTIQALVDIHSLVAPNHEAFCSAK